MRQFPPAIPGTMKWQPLAFCKSLCRVCFADGEKCFIFQEGWFAISIERYHPTELHWHWCDQRFLSGMWEKVIHHRVWVPFSEVWKFNWWKMTWRIGRMEHRMEGCGQFANGFTFYPISAFKWDSVKADWHMQCFWFPVCCYRHNTVCVMVTNFTSLADLEYYQAVHRNKDWENVNKLVCAEHILFIM